MKAITQVIISMLIIAAYSIFAFGIFPAFSAEQTSLEQCSNIMKKDRKFLRCVANGEMEALDDKKTEQNKPDYSQEYNTNKYQNQRGEYYN